ncbi:MULTISPECIES: hypothetical protein [unclassified Spirosoma]|uniref:hypothetical protein n=1 Tax=unclassified Spirosoma TaxID=2621999 RepID=UPI000964D641|nr:MULTISPECIES: hypothetical protein [unclassified Spirosoma]MBN8824023.1 hypothetical protein [Spirosoma sp.]OJW70428.1 MAG: hypothetical protein BGO59_24550 [Spirosoma sp. 48-14]
MERFAYLLSITVCLICQHISLAQGQRPYRVITQDEKGRLVTVENFSGTWYSPTYLGTPYLNDKVWHYGYLVYRNQHKVPAAIAYNLVVDQIYCGLSDSVAIVQALPDEFLFEGRRFISDPYKVLGIQRVTYYEVLYDGPTKLFCRWSKQFRPIDRKLYTRRTPPEDRFDGKYILSKDLYLQKPGDRPRFIIPTEYSLSRVLPDMGPELADFIAAHSQNLTDDVLIEALVRYDKRHPSEQSQ